jgi:regulator of cell morphogenesis and NO signaling
MHFFRPPACHRNRVALIEHRTVTSATYVPGRVWKMRAEKRSLNGSDCGKFTSRSVKARSRNPAIADFLLPSTGTMLAHRGMHGLVRFPARIDYRPRSDRMITTDMTVRDVAMELPQSTRLFEKLKIDYCCGGNKPLAEACASAGVDIGSVMEMLAGATQSQDENVREFKNLSASELITHIVDTHHVFTRSEMDRLQALGDKVLAAHGGNHPELVHLDELLTRLVADLTPHMFKEEQVLFPYIVSMEKAANQNRPAPFAPFGTVNNPIRMMMREHDAAGEIVREIRSLTSDYTVPPDGCISYQTLYRALENFEKDLHQHIHLENNILFPKALDLEAAE